MTEMLASCVNSVFTVTKPNKKGGGKREFFPEPAFLRGPGNLELLNFLS